MNQFKDANGNDVFFSYKRNAFSKEAKHVLVICQFGDQWLLTKHSKRGLEFPGGKKEDGETIEEAAIREVYEETGAKISKLIVVGEYEVVEETSSFVKTIFYGKVDQLDRKEDYLETEGPVLVEEPLLTKRFQREYSFIMQDEVIEKALKRIYELQG